MGGLQEAWKFITEGGSFMYVILGLLVGAIGLSIYRFLSLRLNFRINEKFFGRIKTLVKDGRVREAYNACLTTSHPLSKVVSAVLYNANGTPEAIESAADLEVQKALPGIQEKTNYINMIGNVSTLVGLLGTIAGLIQSFAAVANASASEKAALLSQGIATAMNTTAFGLIVAIPCIVIYTFLTTYEDKLLKKYDEIISEITHLVVHRPHAEKKVNTDTQFMEFDGFKKQG